MNDLDLTGPFRPAAEQVADSPQRIGRYRIERALGKGGFGIVYLAHDEQLQRLVAIKVPHLHLVAFSENAKGYLEEARIVAGLDHPNIVPVFDVGNAEDCPFFVVSKFIEGSTLAQKIKNDRPKVIEATELVCTIAEALHYAHNKGLVHRDIKPGNILLDANGKPFVVDFGLALKEQNVGHGPKFAGTPAYMSPEQARGEGHRVDGRSDIFSLGIVFYELLVGRQPFRGHLQQDLLEQIANFEPRPPRQYDENIPKELDRICLKALSKRASDRYSTAKDMADDMRHYLILPSAKNKDIASFSTKLEVSPPFLSRESSKPMSPATPASSKPPFKIVPKGLRSFETRDADFFLELLPGPRDRDGLPESIRFWKTRIEETDADQTFSVGLIYGPSGCGKSSLVKAGLLPRLSNDVIAVYVEATAEETEARLLNGLRKHCPQLPSNLSLKETLASLRREQHISVGKKVVIILDQFEQWLHSKKEERNSELVQALRQCDGSRLQCIVMVRDDFWLAVSRFLRELEIEIVQSRNIALVDLFDLDHARKVLAAIGRAFGKLPERPGEMSKDQKEFLNRAVSSLAVEGKVICVRLALFAEMMRNKPWTPVTLKEVGGAEGVGVTFLEDTFSSPTANPKHRLHQRAARSLLKALLPELGTDIKGHMRAYADLLEASGYGNRQRDFDELIRLLDSEIRLITPTDPEGKEEINESVPPTQFGQRFYQLTHDYLVPSLREWLTRKQKESSRGRAELLLADRAAVWNARPENRQLLTLWQYFQIRSLTEKKNWTPPQKRMMAKASRYHAVRGVAITVLLCLIGWGSYEVHGTVKANALRDRLLDANTNEVPAIVKEMTPYRRWLDPVLQKARIEAEANGDVRKQLHVSLALLPVDGTQLDYLYTRLLEADPHEIVVIRDELAPHKNALLGRLWRVAETPENGHESQRLRAASALAKYDPDNPQWASIQNAVGNDLVTVPAVYLSLWMESLRPVRTKLIAPLSDVYRDASRRDVERSLATDILANYAADNPQALADLLMNADDKQFVTIYPKFKEQTEIGLPLLTSEIDKKLPADLPPSDEKREKLAKRQVNAAVALLKMNVSERVWHLFKHSHDPRVRSYLIHRLSPLGVDAEAIIKRFEVEPDITIRRALILSLGEFSEPELQPDTRNALLLKIQSIYRTDTDPGMHASTEWLLRQWKQDLWLKQVNEEWAKNKEEWEKRLEGIEKLVSEGNQKAQPQWYVNGQGQTMVVIPGPVDLLMGSPDAEVGRNDNETPHKRRIGRTFSIAAKSVAFEQYRKFHPNHWQLDVYTRAADMPVVIVDWYMAASYCNWLSQQERIPEDQWCYETEPKGATGPKVKMVKLRAKYLSLGGYRLPTEAEMEYATRAGSETARYFGETDELMHKYVWCAKNADFKTWPSGSLKPNDLGFFDVLGNAFTWCQEGWRPYPKGRDVIDDIEDNLSIETPTRMQRGGSYLSQASQLRSACRSNPVPTNCNTFYGFRLARTIVDHR